MGVRSKRLWGPTTVGTSHVTLYTCPAEETALIKTLAVANAYALTNTVTFKLNGTGGAQSLWTEDVPSGKGFIIPELFIVLNPGDTFRALATGASVFITGFGAELEGVAD